MWLGEWHWLNEKDNKKFLKYRDLVEANGHTLCRQRNAYWIDETDDLPPDDNIYRVRIEPTTKCVRVDCIGLESVDAIVDGIYADTSKLPMWMQEKLAVLTMMSPKPPTKNVPDVGRRINDDTYWVYC